MAPGAKLDFRSQGYMRTRACEVTYNGGPLWGIAICRQGKLYFHRGDCEKTFYHFQPLAVSPVGRPAARQRARLYVWAISLSEELIL
jgi:hypothetical protein